MRLNSMIIIPLLLVIMISCNSQVGNKKEDVEEEKVKVSVNDLAVETASSQEDYMEKGKKVYDRECLVCHQSDGSGVPNMHPPITDSESVSGNTDSLIVLILDGMEGPVVVKGEQYNSIMPPLKNVLNDQEIADLINYLRNSFGNSGEFVKPEDVAAMRD
ncbi:MAG: cytochrome c [Bacteroidales bacterium]